MLLLLSHLRVNLQQSAQTLASQCWDTQRCKLKKKRKVFSWMCTMPPRGGGGHVKADDWGRCNWAYERGEQLDKEIFSLWKDNGSNTSDTELKGLSNGFFAPESRGTKAHGLCCLAYHSSSYFFNWQKCNTLQEATSPHTWLIWSCCSLFVSRFYTQHGIVSCTYPNEFILAVAQDEWVCTWRSPSSSIWKTFRNIWITHPSG